MTVISTDTRAVLFDVYGLLVTIPEPRRPFRRLVELAAAGGRYAPGGEAAKNVMTRNLSLREFADLMGIELRPGQIADLERDLAHDLESARLFPDAIPTLSYLRAQGLMIGTCSNLASPYVAPARLLLAPLVDVCTWSCEVGYLKPDKEMFRIALSALGALAASTVMIGDSLSDDIAGARASGMKACHIDRSVPTAASATISSLSALIAGD